MSTTVNMDLNIVARGMNTLVDQSNQFNRNMQSGVTAGGTAGSRMAAARAENQDYNRARGVGSGSTGSTTSDFARQASGLGGLVHVYATFAANLFAAEAAFTSLSKAMDTSNLVRGLDQLGAASGKNLTSLAKNMVMVADGAISLKQAMTSTAMASSGGMSAKDIERMTAVAKNASLALGRDMTDSMDRLTKGIVKIQPELLDELGIMARVIPAQQEYARNLGKSASSLTDFEKRQAFANAVLAEGEKKFGAIDLMSNPYSKLAASASNLMQSGLELLNKVLGPTAKLLAESPTALAGVMGGIALMLLNKAIPAISQWRDGLRAAAVEADRTATRINTAYMEFDIDRRLGPAQQIASQATQLANESISKVQTAIGQSFSKNSKIFKSVMSSSYNAEEGQDMIDTQARRAETRLKTLEEARRITTSTDVAHLASLDEAVAKQKQILDSVKLAAAENAIAAQRQAEAHNALEQATQQAGAEPSMFSEAGQRERIARRAANRAQSMQVLSNVGRNTEVMGMGGAFRSLLEDVNTGAQRFNEAGEAVGRYSTRLTGLSRITTLVRGSFGILTSGIGTLMSAFAPWIMAITLALPLLELLDTKVGNNAKEMEEYSKSVDGVASALTVVNNTVDLIKNKDPLERLSAESTQALANSFKGLSDSLNQTASSFIKAQGSANDWDRFKDTIKSVFGYGMADSMSESLSNSISSTIKLLGSGQAGKEYKDKIAEIFGTKSFDLKSIKKAFEGLNDAAKESKLKEFAKYEEEVSTNANNAASKLTSFKDSLNTVTKSNQDLFTTFQNTDPLSKLGMGLLNTASAMQTISGSAEDSQKAILELLKNTEAMAAIGGDFAIQLAGMRTEFMQNSATAKAYADSIDELTNKIQDLTKAGDDSKTGFWNRLRRSIGGGDIGEAEDAQNAEAVYNAQESLRFSKKGRDSSKQSQADLQKEAQKTLATALQASFEKGAKLIEVSLGLSAQKVALTISKGLLSGLSGTAALDAQKLLTDKEASIQKQLIEANYEQVTASNRLTAVMEGLALQEKLKVEQAKPEGQKNTALISQLEKSIDANSAVNDLLKSPSKTAAKDIADAVQKGLKSDTPDSKEAMVARALLPQYQIQRGRASKLAEAGAAGAALSAEQAGTRPLAEFTENRKAALNYQKELLSLQMNSLSVQDKLLGYTTDANMEAKQLLEREIGKNEAMQSEGTLAAELEGIYAKIGRTSDGEEARILGKEAATKKESLERLKILNAKKQENLLDSQSADLLLLKLQNERELAKLKAGPERLAAQRELDVAQDLVTAKQEQLDYAKGQGRLGDDAYDSATKAAKVEEARIKRQSTLNKVTDEYLDKIREIRDRLDANPEDERAQADAAAQGASYMDAVEAANREYTARQRALDVVYSQTAAERELEKAVNGTATTMVDAFFDATQSGKYNFGDMISSMLSDLARLEFRMYMMQQLSVATGGQGLFAALGMGKLFGGSTAATTPTGPIDVISSALEETANGAAYDQGIKKFANGGAFTNSVVASPTLFKFAKGTGLMGEAGPEAIMPLQRDNAGRLGVAVNGGGSGTGTTTQVVVNNYSNAQAEATETVDSRGQRRVEVTIGNMVAGEIMRPGSSAQQSIKNTFGRAPQLIRR